MSVLSQDQFSPFYYINEALTLISANRVTINDITVPRRNVTKEYTRNNLGEFEVDRTLNNAPTADPSTTILIKAQSALEVIQEALDAGEKIDLALLNISCGDLEDDTLADFAYLLQGAQATQNTISGPLDGPANGTAFVTDGNDITFDRLVKWPLDLTTSPVATGSSNDITDIGVLNDPSRTCYIGYPGPGQIVAAVTSGGEVYVSLNQGGTWTKITANPFTTNTLKGVGMKILNNESFRLVVGDGVAGTTTDVAYVDLDFASINAGVSWTTVQVAGTGQAVGAIGWPKPRKLIVGAAGNLYTSTNKGVSFGAAVASGTTAINGIVGNGNDVFVFGASNAILKQVGNATGFSSRVGPSGGGTFYSIAVASDGRIFAGNGAKIYVAAKDPTSASVWTELLDLSTLGGGSYVARGLKIGGNNAPNFVRAFIDDTTPGTGFMLQSLDFGNNWTTKISGIADGIPCHVNTGRENTYLVGGRTNGNVTKIS